MIESLSLHRKAELTFEHVPFVIAYAYGIYAMYTSVGQPFQEALEKASRTEPEEGSDFLPPCVPLPGEHMPSFTSRLFMGTTIILHILLYLIQYWSLKALCWLKYRSAPLNEATHALVIPPLHQGKAEIVKVERTTKGIPCIRFQKQNYMYNEHVEENHGFVRVPCPDNLPLSHYSKYPGLSRAAAKTRLMQYGENKFEIELPSFQQLYLQGILQPFSVFQIFCVLLWCLDEYWQFSLFTLAMIFIFEGTVVMTRRKNLTSLHGMNNAPRSVYVRRDGVWFQVSAQKLLPGDIISVPRGSGVDADVVPCDCLILGGNAVVNEATLTGESVPQMKEGIVIDEDCSDACLDIQNVHKVHALWGGTRILQYNGAVSETDRLWSNEASQDEVDRLRSLDATVFPTGTPDGGCLCYVLRTGFDSSQGRLVRMIQFSSENVSGNTKEALLLVLFLLIFAVTASAYVLKRGLENGSDQFRLLIHCILIVTSVIPPELYMQMTLAVNTSLMALMKLMVYCTEPFRIPLAGKIDTCLFDKTGTITTDELVAAGVIAISQFDEATAHKQHKKLACSVPQERQSMNTMPLEASAVISGCHSLVDIDGKVTGDPVEEAALKAIKWKFDPVTATAKPTPDTVVTWPSTIKPSVKIQLRHHFASKLQRMSVIAHVETQQTCAMNGLCVLSKGSPEMIRTLLKEGTVPAWYDVTHKYLAKTGMRVIALAYRRCTEAEQANISDVARSVLESELLFVGFLAFRCLVRADSRAVVEDLKRSAHRVVMVTGDAPLTAIHVAMEVSITQNSRQRLLVLDEHADGSLVWLSADTDRIVEKCNPSSIPKLAASFDLCVTGPTWTKATLQWPAIWQHVDRFLVFARMTPDQKEKLMIALKDLKHHTLMCGDGANDVGALKQAHVGVALLSGFGNANVERDQFSDKANNEKENKIIEKASKQQLTFTEQQRQLQEEMQEEIARLEAKGESWVQWKAMRNVMARQQRRKQEEMKKFGNSNVASHAAILASQDLDDGSVPMVKLGDASIAAPFTSKRPSIESTLSVIRQGRCTLVTTLQMYQILALNCLISSYSLSALYLDGVKASDRQLTVRGLLLTVSFLSISRASPLKKLSSVRPLESIFHPALFLSLLGQFAIHLTCMILAVSMSKPHLPAGWEPNITGKFESNLINSVVFLIECVQQVCVFVVNYKGQPFMSSITTNSFLLYSVAICGVGAFLAASNLFPQFNTILELVEYPSEGFRQNFCILLVVNVLATFLWDRLMLFIFARHVLVAGLRSITKADIRATVKMLLIVGTILYLLASADKEFWDDFERAIEENEQQ
eukprot:gene10353-2488_t